MVDLILRILSTKNLLNGSFWHGSNILSQTIRDHISTTLNNMSNATAATYIIAYY